jgi:hypothetical protein
MRDLDIVHDHQWSAREKAKDAITLRLPLSRTDIIGRMETYPLSKDMLMKNNDCAGIP